MYELEGANSSAAAKECAALQAGMAFAKSDRVPSSGYATVSGGVSIPKFVLVPLTLRSGAFLSDMPT